MQESQEAWDGEALRWVHRTYMGRWGNGRTNNAGRNEGIVFTRDSNLERSRDIYSPHVCKEQSAASAP